MFYAIKIETATSGTETRDIRQFDDLDSAEIRYHSDLSKYIGNTSSILEMIINDSGTVLKREKWSAPVEEVTEESAE